MSAPRYRPTRVGGCLQAELEDLLPCRVDIVPSGGLKERMRERILAEARAI